MRSKVPMALVALLFASAAWAYVIPAASILRRLVERRDDLRLNTLKVTGSVSFGGEAAREAAPILGASGERDVIADGTISLKLPGRCRLDASTPEEKRIALASANGKRRAEGGELPSLTQALTQICPLLAFRSASEGDARDGLYKYLRSLGVDDSQTSLARFDGRIVYVIGKPGPDQPQLWVYKDSFLPARILYTEREGGRRWDVRFRDFGSPVAGDWFPRIVEVARPGPTGADDSLMRFTALAADGRAPLGDELF